MTKIGTNDTRYQILRVVEENVDGCGTDAIAYVMFNKAITDKVRERFEGHLRAVKQRTASCDYDTEEMLREAVEKFNESIFAHSVGYVVEIIDAPYYGVITF